jgi:hypothetical protein
MAKKNHTHQYRRVKLKNVSVFRCMLTNCPHYIGEEFILGRESLCPSCGKEFIIDKYASLRTNPICLDCRDVSPKSKKKSNRSPDVQPSVVADILKRYGVQ